MMLISVSLTRAGGSSPILVFQMAVLAMLASEHSMLEIIYAPTMQYLKEGETLNLSCVIRHQQDQSSQLEAHWYKKAMKQSETGFAKEMESLYLAENSDPKAEVTSSLILRIQKVSQSDSGQYQCRAKIKNIALTAVGHFIGVNVTGCETKNDCCHAVAVSVIIVNNTERTERDLEQNKALRVDSELEKLWALVMISWVIVYVKGLVP